MSVTIPRWKLINCRNIYFVCNIVVIYSNSIDSIIPGFYDFIQEIMQHYFEEYATLSWKEYNIILKSMQHYPKKNKTLFWRICNMFLKNMQDYPEDYAALSWKISNMIQNIMRDYPKDYTALFWRECNIQASLFGKCKTNANEQYATWWCNLSRLVFKVTFQENVQHYIVGIPLQVNMQQYSGK